jgi:4-diphosphocytidyl-2C-methyl-D-erythritol kinase
MTVATFAERAGIMAVANDLAAATAALVPGLVPFRRALARLVARPVAQSGSGPTLWVIYPSSEAAETAAGLVRDALAAGELTPPGDRPAFVAAASIAVGVPSGAAEPARPAENTDQGGT